MEGLGKAARHAPELTICIEPLNRFETYFLNTQADAAKLVKEVDAPIFASTSIPFTRTSRKRIPPQPYNPSPAISAICTSSRMIVEFQEPGTLTGGEF